MDTMSFDVWEADEPEFLKDMEYKFDVITHPVNMAMGTGGKNDHLAKEAVSVLADWALRKLFMACLKVCWWCGVEIVKRFNK